MKILSENTATTARTAFGDKNTAAMIDRIKRSARQIYKMRRPGHGARVEGLVKDGVAGPAKLVKDELELHAQRAVVSHRVDEPTATIVIVADTAGCRSI
jgi:hypothetical protein